MAEQMIYISKNAEHYSEALKKMIKDIAEEMTNGIKDGLAYKLANVENEEAKLHAFIKNEGYDITYKEFSDFIVDAKEIVTLNADFIQESMAEKLAEASSEELSDEDLEQVAGGKLKWWQWLLIGVAAVAIVVACIVAAPVVAAVGTAVAAGAGTVGACLAFSVGGSALAAGLVTGASVAAGVGVVAGAAAGLSTIGNKK